MTVRTRATDSKLESDERKVFLLFRLRRNDRCEEHKGVKRTQSPRTFICCEFVVSS